MTSIRDRIDYNDGYAKGYAKGVEDTFASLEEWVTTQRTAEVFPARRGAPQQQPAAAAANGAKAPRRHRRRGFTLTEGRVLDFVAANPGCTMADIEAIGITGKGTVYSLVARHKLMRREDPKPHLGGRPWVHFYPMEPRNG